MPIDTSFYTTKAAEPVNPLKTAADYAGVANALQQNQLLQTQNKLHQVGLAADEAALAMQRTKAFNEYVAPIAADPNITDDKMIEYVNDGVKRKLFNYQDAAMMLQNMPQNPQERQQLAHRMLVNGLNAEARLKETYGEPSKIENGPNILSGYTAPASQKGGFYADTSTPVQLSPSQKVQQNPIYDVAEKRPGSISVGQQYDNEGNIKTENVWPDKVTEKELEAAVAPAGAIPQEQKTAGGIVPIAPALGEQEAAIGAVKGLNDLYDSVRGTGPRIFQLQQALHGLQNTTTGPGTETTNRIKSFLLAQSPESLKNIGVTPDDINVANYDKANKYLTQYASSAASSGGYQTDAKLATALSGNASTKISNLAAQDVVKAAIALERMQQSQAQAFQQAGLPENAFNKWQTEWNKKVDPRVFMMDELTPKQRNTLIGSLGKEDRSKFAVQLRDAIKNGYVTSPGQ